MTNPIEQPESGEPQVGIPQMCEKHRYDFLVRRMKLGPDDLRLAIEVTVQILLFRLCAGDPRIAARSENKATNLSLILGEIGCMACWNPKAYRLAYRVCQKGLDHAAKVAQGKLADDGFELLVPPAGEAP